MEAKRAYAVSFSLYGRDYTVMAKNKEDAERKAMKMLQEDANSSVADFISGVSVN